jgi:DNA topoisomerase-1
VEPPDFKPCYEVTERGTAAVAKLKALAKQADAVYLATDPDREGESISWHLQQCLRLDNPLRVTFSEITPVAVKQALTTPRSADVRVVGRTRSPPCLRSACRLPGQPGVFPANWPAPPGGP